MAEEAKGKENQIKAGQNEIELSESRLVFFPWSNLSPFQLQEKVSGAVALDTVHFSYPSRPDVPVLQGLSVNLEPGKSLALVGPSGCGKSTIVSLIERFYDPSSGLVKMEEVDIRDLNIGWLRSQIGIVSQEPILFDASIAYNIRYGALFRDVTDEEVTAAAKAANIHSFIETLPQVRACAVYLNHTHWTHPLDTPLFLLYCFWC